MKVILILVVVYLVVRYLIRPILMAFVVKSAGKMMKDMSDRNTNAGNTQGKDAPKTKGSKEVPGEYIDYEEVK